MVNFGKNKAEQCAKEIISFLLEHGLWQDTFIYANNRRFGCYDGRKNYHYYYNDGYDKEAPWDCVFVEEDVHPEDYLDWASDFLSMSFEGPFYDIINYNRSISYCDKVLEEFNSIIHKYGYYYEVGNAWDLSLFKI